MKKLITCMIIILAVLNIQAASNNKEVLLGIRTGGGLATQEVRLQSNWGVSSSKYKYNNMGYTIPLKLEVLAGIKKLRIGYTFEYAYSCFVKNRIYTKTSSPAPQYPSYEGTRMSNDPIVQNYIGNNLVLEYVSFSKGRFAISPAAKVGFFVSQGIVVQDFRDESKPKWQAGLAVGASLNFEVKDKKATTYVFAPTYSFYTGGAAQRIWGQSVGLDVAFRFRLTKKKGEPSVPRF